MQLKRGLERKSCDFCYRRKIKCDRWTRGIEKKDQCSQCDLRQVPCCFDDSDDIRIRRRRRETSSTNGSNFCSPLQQQQHQQEQRPAEVCHGGHQQAQADLLDHLNQPESSHTSAVWLPHHVTVTGPEPNTAGRVSLAECDVGCAQFDTTEDDTFLSSLFTLSPDSSSFLNQTFMRTPEMLERSRWPSTVIAHTADSLNTTTQDQSASVLAFGRVDVPVPRELSDIDPTVFGSAIHAYFDLASLCLPILLEDAFWGDFSAGHCSDALLLAVACRGMPFTASEDKWQLQQQIALRFREVFLECQQRAATGEMARLDEVEALALMVDFDYQDAHSPPLEARLGKLLLTHDTLVLITLQARIDKNHSLAQSSWTKLAKAEERRMLLFWHVYGQDAFHSLDRKTISRIQHDAADFDEQVPAHHARGYLDAILALAIIARRILQVFCSPRAKQRGVRFEEVRSLYEHVEHWREVACPSYLRSRGTNVRDTEGISRHDNFSAAETNKILQLQRATIGFLECNCYMQIESCVERFGIYDQGPLDQEVLTSRVEYETLRAVRDITALSQWATTNQMRGQDSRSHSFIDLAPHMLRDIGAGVCVWMCLRGQSVQPWGSPYLPASERVEEVPRNHSKVQQIAQYTETATTLRDAVATATSHRDTEQILAHLNIQLDLLRHSNLN